MSDAVQKYVCSSGVPQTPTVKTWQARSQALCDIQEFAELLAKTTCDAKDISFDQLVDTTKITTQQKPILVKFRMQADALYKELQEWRRKNGNITDKQIADYVDTQQSVYDQYNLDLYNGKINWGEYNKARKEEYEKNMAELTKITNAVNQHPYAVQPVQQQPTVVYQQQQQDGYVPPQSQPMPQIQLAPTVTMPTITPYQLPMPQQPVIVQPQQPVFSQPKNTNCYRVGNQLNCTTQ